MIQSEFQADQHLMVHTGSGNASARDILSASQQWFEHSAFDAQTPVIWNFSEAQVDVSMDDLQGMYTVLHSGVQAKRTGGRTAWVHQLGLVRSMIDIVYQEFNWDSDWKTFQSLEEAAAWCR